MALAAAHRTLAVWTRPRRDRPTGLQHDYTRYSTHVPGAGPRRTLLWLDLTNKRSVLVK
jgi:hypothetical protein